MLKHLLTLYSTFGAQLADPVCAHGVAGNVPHSGRLFHLAFQQVCCISADNLSSSDIVSSGNLGNNHEQICLYQTKENYAAQ